MEERIILSIEKRGEPSQYLTAQMFQGKPSMSPLKKSQKLVLSPSFKEYNSKKLATPTYSIPTSPRLSKFVESPGEALSSKFFSHCPSNMGLNQFPNLEEEKDDKKSSPAKIFCKSSVTIKAKNKTKRKASVVLPNSDKEPTTPIIDRKEITEVLLKRKSSRELMKISKNGSIVKSSRNVFYNGVIITSRNSSQKRGIPYSRSMVGTDLLEKFIQEHRNDHLSEKPEAHVVPATEKGKTKSVWQSKLTADIHSTPGKPRHEESVMQRKCT